MIDLSDWNTVFKSVPEDKTFGQWMREDHPEQWNTLIEQAQSVLDNYFPFLKEWKFRELASFTDIREVASRLLSGGIIVKHPNIDFRVAGVLAENVLPKDDT
jgi:hypothetical protein